MPIGNLRRIANNNVRVVNPDVLATLCTSTGFSVGANFKQIPTYSFSAVLANVQALSSGDIRQLDALNIQGAQKAVYIDGVSLGVNRIQSRGGDLLVFAAGAVPEGTTWLVLASLEQWGGTWAKVAVILQDFNIVVPPLGTLTTDLSKPGSEVIVPTLLTGV